MRCTILLLNLQAGASQTVESNEGKDSTPSATVVKLKGGKRKLARKIACRKRRKILAREVCTMAA